MAGAARRPVALLLPDPASHTRLRLQPEALSLLQRLEGPISVVSVVGAYRTGKSWLLNELMGLGCDAGFVVGHQRHTQTKGVWILPGDRANATTRLFMDTEGFDGTGQAEVYDDRIFAFAALVSDVIVYNLAETIKQADIERLAFAAQLSHEFWRRAHRPAVDGGEDGNGVVATGGGGGGSGEWTPPALLWLVQRDFLQGGSVENYLQQALNPTAASTSAGANAKPADEHAQRLDQVREALKACFGRMRAMGLVQPHVRRTELCSLPRSSFDAEYLKGAAEVSTFVREHSTPAPQTRSSASRALSGEALANLVSRVVEALNTHDIPTAGSVVDAFNARLVQTALGKLKDGLKLLKLPLAQTALEAAHARLLVAAQRTLREQSFGASQPTELATAAAEALKALSDANFVASQRSCDDAWSSCEASIRGSKGAWLPSTSRFTARIAACNATMGACVGPAADHFHLQLLPRLAADGASEYASTYREQLHRALVVGSVAGVLVSRLLLRSTLLELLCAALFICVELLPALLPFGVGAQWLWDTSYVRRSVDVYEALVFNAVWDLEQMMPVLLIGCALVCICRWVRSRRRRRGATAVTAGSSIVQAAGRVREGLSSVASRASPGLSEVLVEPTKDR